MRTKRKSQGRQILARRKKFIYAAIPAAVRQGVEETANMCPVDKGDLISTRTVEEVGPGHVTFGIGGKSNISDRYVNHHIYIELGTSRMTAQPNFRPGIIAAKLAVRQKLANG